MESGRKIMDSVRTRRSFLAATGVGVSTALAGCSGDGGDGGDDATIRMQTATEGTTAYAANEGLAAVVNDNTDEVFVEARPSAGTEANVGDLMDRDAEMVYVQNWTINQIMQGEEPYHEVDFVPAQVFHLYSLPWFFVTANPDIESLSDIDADTQVSPTPEGSGTAPALEHALSFATDDYERVSYTYGEQGSAMEEGRLDVGVGTYMNSAIEPGWLQEMGGTVDLSIPSVGDDVRSEWEDDPGLAVDTFPGDDLDSVTEAPDDVVTPVFEYNFIARDDLDYDTVYNFLETFYEQRDQLEDYHAVLGFLADGETMVEPLFDNAPLHAAAYDFWEEQGLLDDDYERADEP